MTAAEALWMSARRGARDGRMFGSHWRVECCNGIFCIPGRRLPLAEQRASPRCRGPITRLRLSHGHAKGVNVCNCKAVTGLDWRIAKAIDVLPFDSPFPRRAVAPSHPSGWAVGTLQHRRAEPHGGPFETPAH